MRRTFDRASDELRVYDNDWDGDIDADPQMDLPPRSTFRRGQSSFDGAYEGGGRRSASSSIIATPFTILLEMIEGKRPLGHYVHNNPTSYYRNAPSWSVSPFFKLYTRYLSEFSSAMQMLTKMRKGSSNLRKNLKVGNPRRPYI